MKKKIVGIFVMTLLIATAYSSVGIEENTSSSFNNSIEAEDQKNTSGDFWMEVYEGKFYAQGFTPSETPLIKVRFHVSGNPPGNTNITVSIRDALNGDDIVSNMFNIDMIGGVVDFSFPDIDVTIGEIYYIVCNVDKGYLASDCLGWPYSYDNQYDRGDAWYSENGITWYDATDYTIDGFYDIDFAFTTYFRDYAPDACEIDGPIDGKAQEFTDYTFCTNDPEGHDVEYYIEWGDGLVFNWDGPYESGEIATRGHSWASKGNYTIRAKARDSYGAESDWTELEVSMPKNKAISSPFIQFLENHPRLFPLIRQILGL